MQVGPWANGFGARGAAEPDGRDSEQDRFLEASGTERTAVHFTKKVNGGSYLFRLTYTDRTFTDLSIAN